MKVGYLSIFIKTLDVFGADSEGLRITVFPVPTAPINGNKNAPTSAADGKTSWVENWLTPQPKNIIITPSARKYEHATTNGVANILVDDKSSTIDAWNAAGGIGILHVPKNSEKTIQQLADMLN